MAYAPLLKHCPCPKAQQKPMSARMNRKITIQSPAGSRNTVGERVTTWTDVLTDVSAAIEPLTANQRYAISQEQGSITHRILTRYRTELATMDHSWRVMYGSRIFVMVGPPINKNEANEILQLLCNEGLREE
jgi:SPP1 family predicted phage head-tail adaptor